MRPVARDGEFRPDGQRRAAVCVGKRGDAGNDGVARAVGDDAAEARAVIEQGDGRDNELRSVRADNILSHAAGVETLPLIFIRRHAARDDDGEYRILAFHDGDGLRLADDIQVISEGDRALVIKRGELA